MATVLLTLRPVTFTITHDSVGRVAEPDAAIGLDHQIIRGIEPGALIAVDQYLHPAVALGARNAAPAVLASDQPTFAVAVVTVAEMRWLTEHAKALIGRPAQHAVVGNIAPDHATLLADPHRALAPLRPRTKLLKATVRVQDALQPRVEYLDVFHGSVLNASRSCCKPRRSHCPDRRCCAPHRRTPRSAVLPGAPRSHSRLAARRRRPGSVRQSTANRAG
ncbi:hypothetical protein D3C87_1180540 [compost metagenome]